MFVLSYLYQNDGDPKLTLKAFESKREAEKASERTISDQHTYPSNYTEIKISEVEAVNVWDVKRSPRVDLIELKKT